MGHFYLVTQMQTDYVSPGPWVSGVDIRIGIDTSGDGIVDHWSEWQTVEERYARIQGYAKQIERIPAAMDLRDIPPGFGFNFEIRFSDTTENPSKPILDIVKLIFEPVD